MNFSKNFFIDKILRNSLRLKSIKARKLVEISALKILLLFFISYYMIKYTIYFPFLPNHS